MKQLLTPKLDYVFKKLFTADQEILIDLLNTVLELPENRQITTVEIKNPAILPEQITEKYIILDILAIDNRKHQYDIEMQAQKYDEYSQRMLYYLSKLYAGQLISGDVYGELTPVIGIHFLDYERFPTCHDYRFHFGLRDIRYPELHLTDDLSLYIFELPKLEKLIPVEQWGEKMYEWLHFFNHAHEEGEKTMQTHYKNPAIKKAFTVLERLSEDDETRYQAELREEALKFKTIALSAAEKKGKQEIAQKLMKLHIMPIKQIAEISGLTVEELQILTDEELRDQTEMRDNASQFKTIALSAAEKKGELIGEIRLAQKILKQPVSSRDELTQKSLEELQKLFEDLEAYLNKLSIVEREEV